MNRKLIVAAAVVAFLVIVLLAFGGCGGGGPFAASTPTPQPTSAAIKSLGKVVTEGKVVPVRGVSLSFKTGGNVAQAPVKEGDRVEAGALLASLETRQLELQLAQSQASLESARASLNHLKTSPTAEDLAAAKQNLVSAQAAYDNLLHPTMDEVISLKTDCDKAKVMLDQAQAAYDRIGGDTNPNAAMSQEQAQLRMAVLDYQRAQSAFNARINPTAAQVQQALAAIESAKSQLAKIQPTTDDLTTAQANVNAAQAAHDLIAQQLQDAKLVAPFSGVVTTADVKAGEFVAPGVPVIRVADTSAWQVETTDLTELNVVNLREGDGVTVGFDAIPDLELPGKIRLITGYGESKQGDIVYKVTVSLDKYDERLRWNMTAKVNIAKD